MNNNLNKYYICKMNIIVQRILDNGIQTTGKLSIDTGTQSIFDCDTLERPFKDNQNGVSSIPADTYDWVKIAATEKIPYLHISVLNVPNRSGICIHTANEFHQLEGCIAVGINKEVDIDGDGQTDVEESKVTFATMMEKLPDSGKLIVLDPVITD